MADLIKDEIFGEVEYNTYVWVRSLGKTLFGSDVVIRVLVQDENQEGILDVQRKAYQTYLENEEKYIKEAPKYILDYYKWNYEEIDRVVYLEEDKQKDTIAEKALFRMCKVFFLQIARDGSFGWVLGSSWSKIPFVVLLSEQAPRILMNRDEFRYLHKMNDDTFGLLVHDVANSWKGLTKHSFFGVEENLVIELEGSVEDGITEAQKKAYAEYLQKEDELFKKFTEVLKVSGADRTALPKVLYIDREGNYGWICYTEWNKGYVGVLLNKEQPLFMWVGDLKTAAKYQFINDKDCGMLFTDGVSADRIEILFYDNKVYSFAMDFQLVEGELTQEQRKTYKDFMKNKAKYWEDMKDKMLDYYLCIYDDVEANFNVPKEFEKENVTRDKVLKIIKFGRIHFYEDGGGCFIGKCPIANPEGEVLGFEFTDGKIEITELYP